MKVKNVKIKLVSIDFVPEWEEEKPDGSIIFHASIGYKCIEAKVLPKELQDQLIEFCKQGMKDTYGIE